MNSSKFRFTLDLHSIQSQYSIPVMMGDTGVTLLINITDGGIPYTITDGCLAKLSIKRPKGTYIEEFCTIKNNAVIEYPFSQNENTCAVEGIHHCDVTLYSPDGARLGSPSFTMVVSEKVIRSDEVYLSDEDYTAVNAMLAKEAERQIAETERQKGEYGEEYRQTADAQRKQNELDRQRAETERQTGEFGEEARIAAETDRRNYETDRRQKELDRQSAETERQTGEFGETYRQANENERLSKDAERDASIAGAVGTSNEAKAESANALSTANKALEDSANAVSVANTAKNQSDATQTNLINLSAQVQGIGRSYVVPDFLTFINFLNSRTSITLSEDRNGNGINEAYYIYVSDLKTGDNIIIAEQGVPDFWFEKNTARNYGTYTYNGTEYSLSATGGGAHILETDYTVIEGYATSAGASANIAKDAEGKAENHRTWASAYAAEAKEAKNEAELHYVNTLVYAQDADRCANEAKASESEAQTSASKAKASEEKAENYSTLASGCAVEARSSANEAKASADEAKEAKNEAKASEQNAKAYEANALNYAQSTDRLADEAKVSADEAKEAADRANDIVGGKLYANALK